MLCNKQYPDKSETALNSRLNHLQKDANKQNSVQADQQFWVDLFTIFSKFSPIINGRELISKRKSIGKFPKQILCLISLIDASIICF